MTASLVSRALHVRLALVLLVLFLAAGVACLSLVYWSTREYYQEVTQYLNQDLGMYIAEREPLIRDGEVNRPAMASLAHQAMVVNPLVEVYLLDLEGRVLAHTLPPETVVRGRVDVTPVRDFLTGERRLPTRGDDPRSTTGRAVFSAFPVQDLGRPAGYVYAVLGARQYESLPESLNASYILRLSLGAVLALALFGFSALFVVFRLLTRPLRELASDIDRFQRQELRPSQPSPPNADEIVTLRHAFTAMRNRIREQLEALRQTDQVRRELVSNVSHDLRTPLASMQGYLETLAVRNLPAAEQQRYLEIVHRQCLRLSRLVDELFELSKLDLGLVSPNPEPFVLAELAQDVLHKFELEAEQRQIRLVMDNGGSGARVRGDIALLERVVENLLDNALRYTPEGGRVTVAVVEVAGQVRLLVRDTGAGVRAADLPHLCERYYRAADAGEDAAQAGGSGLGLAIVKRVLELHDAQLEVASTEGQGSEFAFALPALGRVGTPRPQRQAVA